MAVKTTRVGNAAVLKASGAQTGPGTDESSGMRLPAMMNAVSVTLDVTAAATSAADTLNVFVQTKFRANWVDIMHFPQLTGTGGAKRYTQKCLAGAAEASFEHGSALASASVRNLLGDQYRARWSAIDANANSEWTFSMAITPM